MTEHPNEQAFIPPHYLLLLSLVGVIIAIVVLFTQPSFTVVGWGGLGIALLSFVAWVLMAPEQARALVTGRTVRFGGTSLLVTVIVLTALIALYTLIRQQNWRLDLTERDTFSLTQESRAAVTALGADPTLPSVKIIAFYGPTQAGSRDRDELLFSDYNETSAGKIEYEFIDPDRNPALATQLNITRPGQIYVARVGETGELDTANGEVVNFFSQDQLTNAILRVSAAGDFRAYFLQVNNGLATFGAGPDGLSTLTNALEQQFDWSVRQVTLFDLAAPESDVELNDPNADGEVMIIPGGDTALTAAELDVITNYLDNGGKVVILAAPSTNPDSSSLATTPALSDYLWENFGLRFRDDVVLDATQALQSPLIPVATDFNTSQYIASTFPPRSGLVFELPHSIELAATAPENVTVEEVASSSSEAYAKADVQAVIDNEIERQDDDATGPFVLAAAAENTATGAKVVLFGSTSIAANAYSLGNNLVNLDAAFNSLIWMTGFDDYFTQVNIQSAQRPQDTPIFVDQQTGGTINLITTFLLPFGLLGIGILVWWNNRETAR
jgi:ABC-2 type transport system permease protein